VYASLALQTRLRPYLDTIDLVIDANGIRFDTTALQAKLTAAYATNPKVGLEDFVELNKFAMPTLNAVGFEALPMLRGWVEAIPANSPLQATLRDLGVSVGTGMAATSSIDVFFGDAAANTVDGGGGADLLDGGAGNDSLSGGEGDDFLMGGAGNDSLSGGAGDDTYLFGKGDGQDTIQSNSGLATDKFNALQFRAGVSPSEIRATRAGNDLVLAIAGTADQVTVRYYFNEDDPSTIYNPIQQVRFADGTSWDLEAITKFYLTGTSGTDVIEGTFKADIILGNGGDDTLYGRGGDDTLDGGAGNDQLFGEAGNDTYLFGRGDGQDTIGADGSGGTAKFNTLQFKAGVTAADIAVTRVNNNWIEFSIVGTNDKITALSFLYEDNLDQFGNPIQQVKFADGTTWDVNAIQAKAIAGNDAAQVIRGYAGADVINGLGGDDFLMGQAGDDTLDGGAGNDRLLGGAGNDTFLFGKGDGQDLIDAEYDAGTTKLNTLQFKAGVLPSEVTVKRDGNDLVFSIAGTTDSVRCTWFFYDGNPASAYNPLQQVKFADGTAWDITALKSLAISGDDTAQILTGYASDDVINARGGDDFLLGEAGNDTLDGGSGNDRLYGGTGSDALLGGAGDDYLQGEEGNDTLDGGAGNDALIGGAGNNTYLFGRGDGQDTVISGASSVAGQINVLQFKAGVLPGDTVFTRTTEDLVLSIAGTTDKITLSGFFFGSDPGNLHSPVQKVDFADGTSWDIAALKAKAIAGDNSAQVLTGYAGDDVINALGGNDTVFGNAGNDTLDGGARNDYIGGDAGNDVLRGGADHDTLYGGDGDDSLEGGTGNDNLLGNNGNDTYLFGKGDGEDTIGGDGEISASKLNVLQFKTGVLPSEVLVSRFRDDLVLSIVGTTDKVTVSWFFESDSPGLSSNPVQVVKFANGTSWDITTLIGKAFAGTSAADYVTGTTAADVMFGLAGNDQLDGRGGDDVLSAGAGNDYLFGGAGNDSLDGGTDADVMYGEMGNDTYIVDNVADVTNESVNAGIDTVKASLNWSLAANLENLTLTGSTAINGTGNELDNVLTGNGAANVLAGGAGNDVLDGGLGNDTLVGGAGNDTYVVNVATDVVTELAGEGMDTVTSLVTWTLGSNLENLTLTGTSAINGTGNTLDNWLIGNAAANTLTGGAGNDILDGGAGTDKLVGGAGDDIYVVDVTTDVVTELANEGTDTVRSSVTWTLGTNLENLTLLGSGTVNATGNTLANVLTGNSANNTLNGGAGADTLDGGAGNDILIGGTGADTYMFGRGWGVDTVQENDTTANVTDRLLFGAGIVKADTKFTRAGNNLEVAILNTADKLVIQDWYLGSQYQVEQFKYADGTTLTAAQAAGLVGAMAAFAAPTAVAASESVPHMRAQQWRGVDLLA
jgi:Ca2+-binding RTX toxin-like protein